MNSINPLVSIVIPVYNGSNYLREAVDSALAQTYKNIEILVINDGSSDEGKTEKIALSYGDKIRYFHKENGGVSSALNLGIEKMEGEFFSWLSHDDLYLKNKIETEINYLSNNGLINKKIILFSDYYLIDSKSNITAHSILDHDMLMKKPEYSLLRGVVNGISLLIPKNAFIEHGLFDENLRCTQDYMLWHKMFKTYKPVHIPEILASYRCHTDQETNKNPRVITEGNELWTMMIKDLSKSDKERLEGSEYFFYYNMRNFLRTTTPYKETEAYCSSAIKRIETEKLDKIDVLTINLINKIDALEQNMESRLNDNKAFLLSERFFRKSKGLVRNIKERGVFYTVRLIFKKAWNFFARSKKS